MPKTTSAATKDKERANKGKGRYVPKRKVCPFCASRAETIDYKDTGLLRRYISDRGRIEPRRRTGVCARHQRTLGVALKRARHIALLPYTPEHVRQSGILSTKEHPS
jgi:small subunit ribosomal protein S18